MKAVQITEHVAGFLRAAPFGRWIFSRGETGAGSGWNEGMASAAGMPCTCGGYGLRQGSVNNSFEVSFSDRRFVRMISGAKAR